MVIQFREDRARNHLLEKGVVYTYRTHKRERVGRDWVCVGRGGKKVADVSIELVREVEGTLFGALKPYARQSGYGRVADWVTAIVRMHGLKNAWERGYLYKVELVK
jgi:hypothetical protein